MASAQLGFVHPKNPKSGCFLQGFLCWQLPCAVQILPYHAPLLAPWICLFQCFPGAAARSPSAQRVGFCSNASNAFSIRLYMCSPIDLHLLMMLCPVKNMIYIIHMWLSYLGKLQLDIFQHIPVRLYFCQIFGAIWGSLCYFQWLFIYNGNPVLEITRCFSSLWDFFKKWYYLFLYCKSSLQLWFRSLSNKLYMDLYKLRFQKRTHFICCLQCIIILYQ